LGEAGWPQLPGYEILGEIGRGGMGVVFKARQAGLNRLVALKMILAGPFAAPAEVARFKSEAEAVARLQHPNVVQVYEVGEHLGRPFLTLEYVAGGSLDEQLAATPQSPSAAAGLVEVLARAVHAAHQCGIIHRDLKPANVLLSSASGGSEPPDGKGSGGSRPPLAGLMPKIADFGLAKLVDADSGQTPSHAVLGTPSYMAPEQALGRPQEVGFAADVYALGAILYECLTGRPPFKAATPYDTMMQVVAEEPVPPRQLQPGVPLDLDTVCLKCLAKEPARRYASALALAEDLQRFLQHRSVLARPAGPLVRLGKFARRNRALTAALAAVFLALVLGIAGTTVGLLRARADRTRALNAEGEARAAERVARRRLAESHRQAARLAMQRGAWRAALVQLDRALEAGHPDEVGLRFDKVRAWYAVHEVRKAGREVEALARRKDLGALEGPVLLWRGDIAWDQTGRESALDLVRQARRKKLPPVDAAYARGLLAKTSPDAVRAFHDALAADPFHRKANAMVAALLLFLGRLDEARERIAFGERLFPEDPTFKALRAALLALGGDRKGADALLAQVRKQVAAPQVRTAQAMVECLYYVHQVNRVLDGSADTALWRLALKVGPPAARLLAVQRAAGRQGKTDTGDFLLPVPPVFVTAMRPLRSLTLPFLFRRYDPVIAKLERITPIHPDGTLFYLHGLLLVQKDRWAEAERSFERAAATPSIGKVRKAALFGAAAAQWYLARRAGPTHAAALRAKALANARKLVALGVTPDTAPSLVVVALGTKEVDLARVIIAAWERQAPRNPAVQHKRLEVELAGGAYGRVLETADRLLKRSARDRIALRYRTLARTRIQEQARALGPAE
jgi:tetratricopeptide (TPR) repeat protein